MVGEEGSAHAPHARVRDQMFCTPYLAPADVRTDDCSVRARYWNRCLYACAPSHPGAVGTPNAEGAPEYEADTGYAYGSSAPHRDRLRVPTDATAAVSEARCSEESVYDERACERLLLL